MLDHEPVTFSALDVGAPGCHMFGCGRRACELWIVRGYYYCGRCRIGMLERELATSEAHTEHARALAVTLEQQLVWRVATWQRNPQDPSDRVSAIGFALFDPRELEGLA